MDLSPRMWNVFGLLLISIGSYAQLTLDKASANATSGTSNVVKDITAPHTDLLRTESGDFVFGPATRIKFKILEEGSGVKTTYFKIGDYPYMQSDGRQMAPHDLKEGEYTILYYSVDNQGNQEQVRTDKVYIDKSGPVVASKFGTSPVAFNDGKPVFSKDVQLTISLADMNTEIHRATYKINDNPKVDSQDLSFIDLTKELSKVDAENVKIEVKAYDVFYNITKEIIEFEVVR